MRTDNKIQALSFDFSLNIIELYKQLIVQKEFVLSKQLLRAGTSIGANIEEAMAAQSKREFIAKMSIASKEARESRYWLKLLDKSKLVELDVNGQLIAVEHIINILTKIVKTSQESLQKSAAIN
jgi:four helix bundle protein